MPLKLSIKVASGSTVGIEIEVAMKVSEVKELIAVQTEVPADRQVRDIFLVIVLCDARLDVLLPFPPLQRLIYSGKVLKDPETMESYNVQDGHTLHMVRTQRQ